MENRFCTKCGHQISVTAKFCEHCGTRLTSHPSEKPVASLTGARTAQTWASEFVQFGQKPLESKEIDAVNSLLSTPLGLNGEIVIAAFRYYRIINPGLFAFLYQELAKSETDIQFAAVREQEDAGVVVKSITDGLFVITSNRLVASSTYKNEVMIRPIRQVSGVEMLQSIHNRLTLALSFNSKSTWLIEFVLPRESVAEAFYSPDLIPENRRAQANTALSLLLSLFQDLIATASDSSHEQV